MDLPDALLSRLEQQFGRNTGDVIVASFSVKRLTTFRTNTLLADDSEVMDRLRDDRIPFERVKNIQHAFFARQSSSKELLEHPLCLEGKIYLQGLSSMLPPLILDPKQGERVLDLCAAPGSKTSQMAAIMKNSGKIVAMESDKIRFEKLQNTINVQKAGIVELMFGDSALLCKSMPDSFDKILADVPCSAEGRINLADKKSYSFWSLKNIIAHAKLQRRLLRSAIFSLKPGGTLVYSTCTLAPLENELMIDWLLGEYSNLQPVPFTSPLSGIAVKNGFYLLPSAIHEGLFVAKLKKS